MSRVRIVTDSTADIPRDILDDMGIITVPLKVLIGSEVYRDGVDITSGELMARMEKEDIMPATSQPSPGEFVAVYEKLTGKGESVISIHLSGRLSGTVRSAQTARTMIDGKNIYVVDSRSASMGLGMIVMAAAAAAGEGKPAREVLSIVKEKIEKSFVLFLVDTLDYLEKGGRIGKATAFLGSLLKIKPILTLDEEGQIVPLEKTRGKNKGLERIIQIITEKTSPSKRYNCAVVYGNDYAAAVRLKEQVEQAVNLKEVYICELGSVILSHTGPGLVGVCICPD